MIRIFRWSVLVGVFLAVALAVGSTAARAEDKTTVYVSPAEGQIDLGAGETLEITLAVTQAVDLNAFDIHITFDADVLQLMCAYGTGDACWQSGGFLSNLLVFNEAHQPGSYQLAVAQGNQPAVSGDGDLFRLTFSGVAPGESDVIIHSAVFADREGNPALPIREDGRIEVLLELCTVRVSISLQGQKPLGGVTLQLGPGERLGYTYQVKSLDLGDHNLVMEGVAVDTYPISTHQPRYLNLHPGMGILVTVDGAVELPDLHLKGGNAFWSDNIINISDLSIVAAWYKRTLADLQEDEALLGDVNFDGVVNIYDLSMVAGNYGLSAEDVYADWQP